MFGDPMHSSDSLIGIAFSMHQGLSLDFHRLGWNRFRGYGEMTEELRVPCDHLEKLHLLRPSVLKLALF